MIAEYYLSLIGITEKQAFRSALFALKAEYYLSLENIESKQAHFALSFSL